MLRSSSEAMAHRADGMAVMSYDVRSASNVTTALSVVTESASSSIAWMTSVSVPRSWVASGSTSNGSVTREP